jgi:nucleoside-diphosphate-sugar epimerase
VVIAITGGSGYIGRLLAAKFLLKGAQVRILSRSLDFMLNGAEIFHGDVTKDSKELESFTKGADILINCAGELLDVGKMSAVHVEGTSRLINYSKGNLKKWIQLSSVGAYGNSLSQIVNENTPENPLGEYECTKTKSDHLVIKSGIPYVILRPSNVFSSEMKNQSIFQLIKALKNGTFFFIGKKGSVMNYVHVDDVVKALMLCSTNHNALSNIYNISQSIDLNNMVNSFLIGMKLNKSFFRLPELPIRLIVKILERFNFFPLSLSRIDALTNFSIFDSSKICKELKFEFGSSLEESFKLLAKKK